MEVLKRAKKTLEWVREKELGLLANALDKFSLGRARMMRMQKEGDRDCSRVMDLVNQAVKGMHEAGRDDFLPRVLLTRAQCYRLQEKFPEAWNDLKEAEEIAEMGDMKLRLCDYHLEAGRLCKDEGKDADAEVHFETAARMVKEMGYWRRREDLGKH